MLIEEQIKKRVVGFGNGSIVYTPKSWIGREVIIALPKLSLKEEVLDLLKPYLENIQGIYLYGSYARGEQEQDSDIDVLVISDKRFSLEKKGYDINVRSLENLKKILIENPVYSLIFKEAKTVLNKSLLDNLKKIKLPISKPNFSFILDTTKDVLEINKQLIDIEDDSFDNVAVIYSLVLRLRGLYMVDCVLKNRLYSNKDFKKFVIKKGINDFDLLYDIYRCIRDNKRIRKANISKDSITKLYILVKNETKKKNAQIN
ncbi:nucleotidyltransferase domain-containing protein [Candidatus Woesearchaeota archaeon]|nr:nucleotidyltransferase domain-containing protein [Candidatus Woesearchaeota archaeon]